MSVLVPPKPNPLKSPLIPPGFIPPSPPAASPSLGFQVFAADPLNQHKIIPAMTQPDAPLQPNASAAANPPLTQTAQALIPPGGFNNPPKVQAQTSNAPNSLSGPMAFTAASKATAIASANHPQMTAQAANAPQQPNTGSAVANPPLTATARALTPPGGFDAAPSSGGLVMPSVPLSISTPKPVVQSQDQANLATDQAKLRGLQDSGAAVNHVNNPILRTLGQIGNIAAPFILGQGAKWIPGTTAHNQMLQREQDTRIGQDQSAIQQQQGQLKDQVDMAHTQAETGAIPINAGMKRQNYLLALANKGMREDQDGNIVPDENSPAYQMEQQKETLLQAQTDNFKAQEELRNAQTAYKQAQTDPNSPLFKQAAQRLQTAQANAGAAQTRAQAYMGNYLMHSRNTDLQGNVLPGATQIADENGNQTVVGTSNAAQATKSQANVAQFNDIDGATNNIEKAAASLVSKGGKLNDPTVAAAIADPNSTAGQWAQGQFVNSGLTPEQRDYVVQVKSYKENLQSLRKSAGGSVSDAQVDRLMTMAPGASTPDLDYLKRQTAQIRQMRSRLASGVSTAQGGLNVAGRPNPMKSPAVQTSPAGGPKVGDVEDGHKFKGGNPADPNNWEKVSK